MSVDEYKRVAAELAVIASLAKSLSDRAEKGQLWPGELNRDVTIIAQALSRIPKEHA